MYDQARTIAETLSMLAATPVRIADLTAGLRPAQLVAPPAPGAWSARDVLAHLRACADVWGGCIATILDADHPTIKAVNPTTWIKRTAYRDEPFHSSLAAFEQQRAGLLAVLGPLLPAAWSRAALVRGAGAPRERTVHTYAEWLVNHERSHLKQIARTVAALHAANGADELRATEE